MPSTLFQFIKLSGWWRMLAQLAVSSVMPALAFGSSGHRVSRERGFVSCQGVERFFPMAVPFRRLEMCELRLMK